MPPPLVFLIPADYFGPVFFFFGQPDGVDVQPDPLGQAVTIPANGILKIKADSSDLVAPFSNEKQRPLYWVSVSKTGQRKVMKYNSGSWKDENGRWFDSYLDETAKLKKFPEIEGKHPYYYYSDSQRNEFMIFQHGGCAHQEFYPTGDTKAKSPACGKFLVATPNQHLDLPSFIWEQFAHPFSSIDDLIKQANEALAEKKAFYKLP